MNNNIKHDITVSQEYQQELIRRLTTQTLLEQESYLLKHPEIKQMLKSYLAKLRYLSPTPTNILKDMVFYFTRPITDIQTEINKLQVNATLISSKNVKKKFDGGDSSFLKKSTTQDEKVATLTENSTSNTSTSSFVSILTSASTLITPEQEPDLEKTTSEKMREEVLMLVNEAVYSQETNEDIHYDIAYVEVMNAVEVAIEIPVVEIRKDVADLLKMAYYMFKIEIDERERIDTFLENLLYISAAQNATEHNIMKKLKRIIRHQSNFKGYETSTITNGSEVSPNATLDMKSEKRRTQCHFNRYPKDHFGVYLPRDTAFSNESITSAVFIDDTTGKDNQNNADIELASQKSYGTLKSGILIATFSNSSRNTSKSSRNMKMNFLKNKSPRGENIDIVSKLCSNHQSSSKLTNVILVKPTPHLFRKRLNGKL